MSGMKRVKILGILGIKSTLVSGTHQGRSSGSNSIVEISKSLEKMKKKQGNKCYSKKFTMCIMSHFN